MTLPRWVRAWVRAVVPPEFADDLLDDLEDRYGRRKREGGAARRWLARELLRTPWLGLRRQARRMRGTGARREMPTPPAVGVGGLGAGLKVAARSLLRRPGYPTVAVVTLAVSIGAATLIFSVLEGVMLRPLPYEGAERIYRVYATNESWREAEQQVLRESWDRLDLTEDMVEALRGAIPGSEALGAYRKATLRLDDGLEPVRLEGARVLPGFFETVPVEPLVGRLPTRDEVASEAPVALLGERLWTSRYGRDPEVVGRRVSLGGEAATVVGVLPASFALPSELARWWTPLPPDFADGRTDVAVFAAFTRLAEGVDPGPAAEGAARVGASLAEENASYAAMGIRLRPLEELVVAEVREGITLLFWAVAVVVLIASVNLANLVVARGSRRRGELAMRAALGASRFDLVWSMLSETALLCAVGGGLGVLAATQLLDPFLALLARASPGFPRVEGVGINGVVLLFSAGVTVLTALLSGLPPALAASRRAPWRALQEGPRSRGGRGARRTQRALLVVEATLAVALLTVAGLLTRSAFHVVTLDPGYAAESVAYLDIETGERYASAAEALELGRTLAGRLSRLPGAVSVAVASGVPGVGGADGKLVWPRDGTQEDGRLVWTTAVSPGYFETLEIPVLAGRTFTPADGPDDPPTVVVSRLFAERWFGEEDPVGRTVFMGTGARLEGGRVVATDERVVTVVGVVEDVRQLSLVTDPDPSMYLPVGQTSAADPTLVLRTDREPEELLEAARSELRAVDPGLLVTGADVLHRANRRLLAPLEVRFVLVVALAALAALLTVVGVYGVVAYVVSDQLHEIGLRMALGARAAGESARMARQALAPVLVGGVVGLGAAWTAAGLVEGALYGVEALDPATYLAVLVLLLAVAAGGAWLPARRAASVDPMRVLSGD